MSKNMSKKPQQENKKINVDKFIYTEEDVKAFKFYKSKEHAEQENKKIGKKTIWY